MSSKVRRAAPEGRRRLSAGTIAVAAGVAILGTTAAAPARATPDQDDLCAALKAAAADASIDFESLRGPEVGHIGDDGGGDDETHYASTRNLPGAVGCDVDRDRSDYEGVIASYVCWFKSAPSKGAAVRRLASRVSDCLGASPTDQLAANVGDIVAEADFSRPGYLISVSAGGEPDTVLEMTPK